MRIVILGGGFSGCVMAYLLHQDGHEVVIIEKEDALGGMTRTFYKEGLAYEIGPHIIYTDSEAVIKFIKRFINIVPNTVYLGTFVENRFISYPPHIDEIQELRAGKRISKELMEVKNRDIDHSNFESYLISSIGETAYKLFYYNFTKKFWSIEPKALTANWAKTRDLSFNLNNIDKKAFSAKYQGYPETDYNDLISGLAKGCRIIKARVNKFLKEPIVDGEPIKGDFYISTIRIDDLFECKFGSLKFKGIKQEIEILNQEYYFSHISSNGKRFSWVYYPNDFDYTRICEYKNINLKPSPRTLIAKEYPTEELSYYPFYTQDSEYLFNKYLIEVSKIDNLLTLGRLGLYVYLTMSDIIKICFKFKDFIYEYPSLTQEERLRRYNKIRRPINDD